VHIITNNREIYDNFTFCSTRTLLRDSPNSVFVFLGEADGRRTIYSSGLLTRYVCPSARYFVDFHDCSSLANDVSSLFALLEFYASHGVPDLFQRRFIPGSSFPREHGLPGGGMCVLAISPADLTPPGRFSVADRMALDFVDFGQSLSLLSHALFPRAPEAASEMPALLLTERIEAGALNGTAVRIIVPRHVVIASAEQLKSIRQFPGVEVRVAEEEGCRMPTFFEFNETAGFMPMPFESLVDRSAITFSLHLRDGGVAGAIRKHFDMLWANTSGIRDCSAVSVKKHASSCLSRPFA
jgi:hypothetical protein